MKKKRSTKRDRVLDQQLDDYASTAASRLATAPSSASPPAWVAYAAAAGAALAMAPATEATPVYSGLQNIMVQRGPGAPGGLSTLQSALLDLDGDGVPDIALELVFEAANGIGSNRDADAGVYLNPLVGTTSNAFFFAGANSYSVRKFPASVNISRGAGGYTYSEGVLRYVDLNYSPGGGRIANPFVYGQWLNSENALAGVLFHRNGGATHHFAWIRIHIGADVDGLPNKVTIVDWAFESQDEVPIHAGDQGLAAVPEPSTGSLALLALGAMGLYEWRRRRKAQPPQA